MLLIPPHDGPTLTEDQATALDDEFFTARPLAYFASRVRSLLADIDAPRDASATEDFLSALRLPSDSPVLNEGDSDDRRLQIAVDSLAVRHHAAESLARLLLAVSDPRDQEERYCVWAAIVEGPNQLHTVATTLRQRFASDQYLLSRALFLPGIDDTTITRKQLSVADAWVRHAIELLTANELTVNAAHNKVKHGLAVRARNDVRVDIVRSMEVDAEGNVPLRAFSDTIPVFDRPAVTYLARPFPRTQGLEVSSLLVDPPRVLAEAWMMAVVHAAVFHVAARSHFETRTADIASYPVLALGPMPAHLLSGRVRGYRGVITTPLDDSIEPRESGLFVGRDFTPMTVDFDNVREVTIVEDPPEERTGDVA